MKLKVKEIMTKDVKGVKIPGSREEALELFRTLNVSAIPAVKRETGELVGMISLRDLFEHADEEQLAMIVNREVPTISPEDDLQEAVKKILQSKSRRLPVLKDGKLVGILTLRDIVYRALTKLKIERPASDFMHSSSVAIWDGTPLKAALEIMDLSGFRALPVIDENGKFVGIVDDSDIAKVSEVETQSSMSQMAGRTEGDSWTWDSEDRIYITKKQLKVPEKLVRDVMTKEPVTITRKTTISRCAELMLEHHIEQLPITDADGKLLGLVYDMNLLKALLS